MTVVNKFMLYIKFINGGHAFIGEYFSINACKQEFSYQEMLRGSNIEMSIECL